MIIPSIDIAGGRVVQLVGGRDHALDAGLPLPWLERFRLAGEVAVVDLDAALGRGDNRELIGTLCDHGACRVGGGIRTYEQAMWWLDRGASRIVIGTAATPALLSRLPRDRVIVALDALHGDVVIEGWRTATGREVAADMRRLEPLVSGFLVTFVEHEGRMSGTDIDRARRLRTVASEVELTIAGGVTTAGEIASLDRLRIDAQVGMAIYTATLDLGDAIAAPLTSDRGDGLVPTIVVDERDGVLGLCWSSAESIRRAVRERRGIYHSRRRGTWIKGETSGDTQELIAVSLDCDRDALKFTVRQRGRGFCHTGRATCWGVASPLTRLEATIRSRAVEAPEGSYSRRLLEDPALLAGKLVEEARELAEAGDRAAVLEESADLLYFTLVRLAAAEATLVDVEQILTRRHRVVTRRPGNAKPSGSRK